MKGKNSILLIFLSLLVLFSCQGSKIDSPNKVSDAEDLIIVENEVEPDTPLIQMHFVEDLSLTNESWWPKIILVNAEGEIFVFSEKERRLDRFDSQGTATFIKNFPNGQAPGEFKGFDPYFSVDNRLFIVDASQRRLTIYDAKFELQNISKLSLWGDIFRLDSKGNMYFLQITFLPDTTDRQKLVLTKCSSDGIPLHELHDYEWGQHRDSNGIYHSDAYRTQLKYKIHNNNIYYITSEKYEINVISPDGKKIRKITKKGTSRKLTPSEIESFKPKKPNPRSVTDIPSNMPYIANLFLLENDFLLVITFESKEEDAFLIGDLFDAEGIYRARVKVPKYYRWNFLLAPSKGQAIFKNGYFYTIESDESEEYFWVKRYKMVLAD